MNFKKLLCAVLALTLVLALAACSEGGLGDAIDKTLNGLNNAVDKTLNGGDTTGDTTGDTSGGTDADLTRFSEGLDENGHFEGVRALDYVALPAFEDVALPEFPKITEGRAIADGDFVNIDFVGSVDGVEFDGGSTGGAGYDIVVGYTSFIDDFIEQLKGHTPGEEFDIDVTFPEEYGNEELNGKDAVFHITINFIWDVTDEAAKAIGFESRDSMGQYVAYNSASMEDTTSGQEVTVLGAACDVTEVPDSVLSKVRSLISESVEADAAQYAAYGFTVDTFLAYFYGASSLDEFLDEQTRPTAEMYLILQAVAERDGITVTDAEIAEAGYDQYAETFGKPYVAYITLQEKVMDHITTQLTTKGS